jgi:hypothetical protein
MQIGWLYFHHWISSFCQVNISSPAITMPNLLRNKKKTLTCKKMHCKFNEKFYECTKNTFPLGLHLPAQCHSFVTSVLSLRRLFCIFTLTARCGHSISILNYKYTNFLTRFKLFYFITSIYHYSSFPLPIQSRPNYGSQHRLTNLIVSLRAAKIRCLSTSRQSFFCKNSMGTNDP